MCNFCNEDVTQAEGDMMPIFETELWMGNLMPRVNFAVSICKADKKAVLEY